MPTLEKRHEYRISRGGRFLGLLPNVTSIYNVVEEINKPFSSLQINVAESPDTIEGEVEPIHDENGNVLQSETGETIYMERVPDIWGNDNEDALIRKYNEIEVVEFSDYYPNGTTVFLGYISKYRPRFGTRPGITVSCLSDGQDLDQYIVSTGESVDQSQVVIDGVIAMTGFDGNDMIVQSYKTGAGVTTLTAVEFEVEDMELNGVHTVLVAEIFDSQSESENFSSTAQLASAQRTLSSTDPTVYKFTFTSPLTVTPLTTYYIRLRTVSSGYFGGFLTTHQISKSTGGGYADGAIRYGAPSFGWTDVTGDTYFKTYTGTGGVDAEYTGEEVSDILRDAIDNYIGQGGLIEYTSDTVDDTGTTQDLSLKLNTALETVSKVQSIAPANWYWRVDPATRLLWFQETNTEADFTLTRGVDIEDLEIDFTVEDLKNIGYFTGGDTGSGENLLLYLADEDSLEENRRGLVRRADNRVTQTNTGTAILQSELDENSEEQHMATVTILETARDTTAFKPGKTVKFQDYGTQVDRLILRIERVRRERDLTTLDVGLLPKRASVEIERLKRDLIAEQTVDNPDTPS